MLLRKQGRKSEMPIQISESLTIRDSFAMAALALGEGVWVTGQLPANAPGNAKKAYALADAMMAERVITLPSKRLPTVAEITGSDPEFTGDLTTDEYIRNVRHGHS